MVSRMLNQSVVESDEPLQITLSGGEHAPGLVRYLNHRASSSPSTVGEEARDAVRVAVASGADRSAPSTAPRFAAATPAPVLLVADSADSQTRKSADRARLMIGAYGSGIAQLRLQAAA
jgi:hypothetical protein